MNRWASWFGYRVDDLADCTTAGCPSRLITDTYAVWSPDGRQRIFRDQQGNVFRQTAEGTTAQLAVAAENVARSFWVDNDTYGLVTLAADGESYTGRVWLRPWGTELILCKTYSPIRYETAVSWP